MFSRLSGLGVALAILLTVNAVSPLLLGGETGNTNLPLKRVVLFSSGVGFFQHDGQVKDNAKIELKFKVDDINDLLKSMVVEDLDGGQVSTVTYGSKDPISKSLKSFAIDLTTEPTLADLLKQVRGERVEVDRPAKLSGTILGVEKQKQELERGKTIERDVLNLLTDEGLWALPLDSVGRLRLANPALDAELRKALALLASSHATDKKSVGLSFLGKGSRHARIGYIQETPIWKTSYRLVLGQEKPPHLQGWAIVENTTEEDWSDVQLTLVSGRPISFTMDLYQPLYVARPQVELERYASLRPQVYGQDLAKRDAAFRARGEADRALARATEVAAPAPGMMPPPAPATPYPAAGGGFASRGSGSRSAGPGAAPMDPTRGVRSVAEAGDVGELFQYSIGTPVSLPRQQSAMLPIVNEEVKAEKVSIYNPSVHPKHPLNGLQLTNSTKLNLMQGPITVFDDDVYAGDAKIENLAPGTQRLLSYAMDLDTEVAQQSREKPERLVTLRIFRGTMTVTHRYARSQEYTIKNSGRRPKKVLIEQRFEGDWKLVAPAKPEEKTRDLYRFAVTAKPGESAQLAVEEERIEGRQMALTNVDENLIQIYLSSREVSDKIKAGLAEVVKRKTELGRLGEQRKEVERRLREINEEQSRIRQNMERLDRTSDLYKRYVTKLSDQEEEVEKLRQKVADLDRQQERQRRDLDEFMNGLDLGEGGAATPIPTPQPAMPPA